MGSKTLKLEALRNAPQTMALDIVLAKLRYMQILLLVFLGVIVGLVAIIIIMMPLKTTEVRYVEFANDENVTPKVFSSNLNTTSKRLLVRSFLRNYVVNRHTIDDVSERVRFKNVLAMSNKQIFDVHKEVYFQVKEALGSTGTREIRITYDQPISKGLHEIEFETIDLFKGKRLVQEWVVKIKYTIPKAYKISKDEELINPLGLKIHGYHFTQKEKANRG